MKAVEEEIIENSADGTIRSVIGSMKSIGGLKFLLIGLLCGVALLIIGSYTTADDDKAEDGTYQKSEIQFRQYMSEYLDAAEQEFRALIEHIDGVSNVRVMLTLECLNEYVYAQNGTGKEAYTYLTVSDSSNDESPVLIKEISPRIRGVGVVCKGGSNPAIQLKIIELCCSVFGISSNCVSVVEGK